MPNAPRGDCHTPSHGLRYACRLPCRGYTVPRLIVVRGVDEGKQFDLTDPTITVGRHSANAVPLHDTQVSRRHLELRALTAGGYELHDLGSGNGTLLNGRPVNSGVLRSGDHV